MNLIDVGDLFLSKQSSSLQQTLFDAIQQKIINGHWKREQKLPSTRKMAEELALSRNTVTSAYEQLVAEGYLQSRKGSGFFVAVSIPEYFLKTVVSQSERPDRSDVNNKESSLVPPFDTQRSLYLNRPFSPGIPDLAEFPYAKWQRLLQRHIHRDSLSGMGDIQGYFPLREALSHYLQSSRSVSCHPNRIIVTSGAQQALSIATLATLDPNQTVLMEEPGYSQMRKVLNLYRIKMVSVSVDPLLGLNIASLLKHKAAAVYLTPSNQYPMGTSLNTEQRLQILQWAEANQAWVIEDDYDSEFQFAHRPYTSLQGLSAQSEFSDRCIYVGSLSKTMFNGLRIGYMVVPESLVEACLKIKDAMAGNTAIHSQAALADFISEGHFLRHLRRMRKIYQQKSILLRDALTQHFGREWQVISQEAGLHTTVRWQGSPSENQVVVAAEKKGITVRPLSYYEKHIHQRDWNALVLGYGNVQSNKIEPLIAQLRQIYLNL